MKKANGKLTSSESLDNSILAAAFLLRKFRVTGGLLIDSSTAMNSAGSFSSFTTADGGFI